MSTSFTYSLPTSDLEHVLRHTPGLWEEVRGQRVFIAGGTGFFGVWLVESFLWINQALGLDAHVHVLSREPQRFLRRLPHLAERPDLVLHQGDVRSFVFPDGEFAHVIQGATDTVGRRDAEDPWQTLDTIVQGTRRALDFARQCGSRNFLLTSSGAIYGRQPPELTQVPEEYLGAPDPLSPATVHAQSKRLAEHLCALSAQQFGLATKVARCFAFVGPYLPLDAHFAVGNFIRDGLRGGPLVIRGDGTPVRSYLYAADLAIWLWTLLLRGASSRVYNVGSVKAVSIARLAETVADTFRPRPAVQILGTPVPNQPAERYVPDTRRAQQELGLQERIELRTAVERTIAWNRERGWPERTGESRTG